jgi:FtsH-binding integral membrane protein
MKNKKNIMAFEILGWIFLGLFVVVQLFSFTQTILPMVFLVTTLLFSVLSGIFAMNEHDTPPLTVTIRRLLPALCIVVYLASWIFRFID